MLFVTLNLPTRLQPNLNKPSRLRCGSLPNGVFRGPQYRKSYSS